jgi:hypothetical protein
MLRALCAFTFFIASSVVAQNCSTYAVVDPFDSKTTLGIDGLKASNFEAKAGSLLLPIVSAAQNFNSRVLVLLQIGTSPEQEGMQREARQIADVVRDVPAGRPIAFGVFAEKTFISREFAADPQKRAAAINEVLGQAAQLRGKTSAVYDSLHEALAAFGPHRPGDAILLMGDGVDYSSKRNPSDLEKEFLASGTRLLVVIEPNVTPMVANTVAKIHRRPVAPGLKFLSSISGGAYRYSQSGRFLDFVWAGYLVEVQVPATWDKPKEWQLRLKDSSGKIDKKALVFAPLKLAPCGNLAASTAP